MKNTNKTLTTTFLSALLFAGVVATGCVADQPAPATESGGDDIDAVAGAGGARRFRTADLAGTWSGTGTGTALGAKFSTVFVIHADASGHLTVSILSTVEPDNVDECTVTVQANGLGTGTCTLGPAFPGLVSDIRFVLSDRELRFFQTLPGTDLITTGIATRQ
jgi:hypothetical protein